MNHSNYIEIAIKTSKKAGDAILEVYNSDDFSIESKLDNSPLTKADRNAHDIIETTLKTTILPLLSEEGVTIPFNLRKNWDLFWLVDPLDGTKEFIKRNGEFTVNIALIQNNLPIAGVIYVPVSDEMYFAEESLGSYKVDAFSKKSYHNIEELIKLSKKLPIKENLINRKFTVVGSRSHMSSETQEFFDALQKKHNEIEILSKGSSLKLCMVAEGLADTYPRFAPTMEWDTAAGHAIAKIAGYSIINKKTDKELNYNKENLLNDWFVVS